MADDTTSELKETPPAEKTGGGADGDTRNAMLRDLMFISQDNHLELKTSSHIIYNGKFQQDQVDESLSGPIDYDPKTVAEACSGEGSGGGKGFSYSWTCKDFIGRMLFKKQYVMDSDPAKASVCAVNQKRVKYIDSKGKSQEITGEVAQTTGGITVRGVDGQETVIPTGKTESQEDVKPSIQSVDITRKFPMHGYWYPSVSVPVYKFRFTPPTDEPPVKDPEKTINVVPIPDGGGCFVASTPIMLSNGLTRPIAEIGVSDTVLAFDSSGGIVNTIVRGVLVYRVKEYLRVCVGNIALNVTREHPFYAGGGKYRSIGTLCVGDTVFVIEGVRLAERKISSIDLVRKDSVVYNLSVDDPHTYFACGVAVHNKGGGSGGDSVTTITNIDNTIINNGGGGG